MDSNLQPQCLSFTDRLTLEKLFLEFCDKNKTQAGALNCIMFLQINGLLNEDACIKYARGDNDEKKN